MGDAEVGQQGAGGEHRVEVHRRLPHAHEDDVVDRLDAAEVERLVEDLVGAQVAAELHLAGGAEGAGQRAAGLRGEADRAAAVAVAHQDRLQRAPVGGAEERLDGAVVGASLGVDGQRRERHRVLEALAQGRRQVGHLARRSGRRAPPTPTPGRRGRRARRPRRGCWRAARGPPAECRSGADLTCAGGVPTVYLGVYTGTENVCAARRARSGAGAAASPAAALGAEGRRRLPERNTAPKRTRAGSHPHRAAALWHRSSGRYRQDATGRSTSNFGDGTSADYVFEGEDGLPGSHTFPHYGEYHRAIRDSAGTASRPRPKPAPIQTASTRKSSTQARRHRRPEERRRNRTRRKRKKKNKEKEQSPKGGAERPEDNPAEPGSESGAGKANPGPAEPPTLAPLLRRRLRPPGRLQKGAQVSSAAQEKLDGAGRPRSPASSATSGQGRRGRSAAGAARAASSARLG